MCFHWFVGDLANFKQCYFCYLDILLRNASFISFVGCHGIKPGNEGRFFMFLMIDIAVGTYYFLNFGLSPSSPCF
jgi:hypothetical protein